MQREARTGTEKDKDGDRQRERKKKNDKLFERFDFMRGFANFMLMT